MQKIKWLDLIIALCCIYIIATALFLDNAASYYGYSQASYGHEYEAPSILHYIVYKVNGWGGQVGVSYFFLSIAFYFIYSFYKDNATSILSYYQSRKAE